MSSRVRFEVVRVLGSGGMGDVFLARMTDSTGETKVALKRVRPGLLAEDKVVTQFQRECRISSALEHPNIVALYAHGSDREGPYMAMEFVDGLPASKLAQAASRTGSVFPTSTVFLIASDAAKGLVYAHSLNDESLGLSGVIHRDISPDNILVSRSGVSKVADFGIAKVLGGTSSTDTGSIKGKLPYMAPELFHGKEADIKTDVFAFGATLYWLLAGVAPFHGRTEAETMRAVLNSAPTPLSSLVQGVPPEIENWISQALEKDPALRPDNLRVIESLLSGLCDAEARIVLGKLVESVVAPEEAMAPSLPFDRIGTTEHIAGRKPSKRMWPLWSAVGVVPVLLVFFLLWITRPAPTPPIPRAELSPPGASSPFVTPNPLPSAPTPAPSETTTASAAAPKEVKPVKAIQRAVPKPPKSREGRLRVKVKPWADMFIDGEHLGKTPLEAVALSPGSHSVILVNNELKVRRQLAVKITAGKETLLKVDLEAADPNASR